MRENDWIKKPIVIIEDPISKAEDLYKYTIPKKKVGTNGRETQNQPKK